MNAVSLLPFGSPSCHLLKTSWLRLCREKAGPASVCMGLRITNSCHSVARAGVTVILLKKAFCKGFKLFFKKCPFVLPQESGMF